MCNMHNLVADSCLCSHAEFKVIIVSKCVSTAALRIKLFPSSTLPLLPAD